MASTAPRFRVPARGLRCRIPVLEEVSDVFVITGEHFDMMLVEYKLSCCIFLLYRDY
jgi:hypothetical protein